MRMSMMPVPKPTRHGIHICANREECLFSDRYAGGRGECQHSVAHTLGSACVHGGASNSDCMDVSELDPDERCEVVQRYRDRLFTDQAIKAIGRTPQEHGCTLKPCCGAVRRRERGWPAHFFVLVNKDMMGCIFHRNTLLTFTRSNLTVVVSTVGNLPDNKEINGTRMIGPNTYYRTAAFHSLPKDRGLDGTRPIAFLSPRRVDRACNGADQEANQMHDDVVQEIVDRMLRGETFPELGEE